MPIRPPSPLPWPLRVVRWCERRNIRAVFLISTGHKLRGAAIFLSVLPVAFVMRWLAVFMIALGFE